jgi:hypothetical protein
MNGTFVSSETFGNLALKSVCFLKSPEESSKVWEREVGLFNFMITDEQRTGAKQEHEMSKTHGSVDRSLKQNRRYSMYSQLIYKKELSDIFPKAVRRLQGLENLKENWNGDQSLPPSTNTIEHAYAILENIWREAFVRKARILEPRVTCGAGGDITFAWTIGQRELELGFWVEHGMPQYEYLVCATPDECSCEEGSFEGELRDSHVFNALISWLQ